MNPLVQQLSSIEHIKPLRFLQEFKNAFVTIYTFMRDQKRVSYQSLINLAQNLYKTNIKTKFYCPSDSPIDTSVAQRWQDVVLALMKMVCT